ncbi:ROK family protein [Alginatibacterium sediminis]|uniref:ROK family protein n=1 Tax=Alginatibacterium sediminis TaxID=2164068 RepID=A0A420ECZ5_9ALTE|nr:ROK family protein [Alginatibacterium sediminis]RKF18550.1 ROK family protein [Alginatibacterium sediminis]
MYIGFDIGGTKTEIIVLDAHGEQHFKKRIPTEHDYQGFLNNIESLVLEAERSVGGACSVGIGLPGVLDPRTGLIKNANCTFLNGHQLKKDLDARLNRSVAIANDANCFALSEAVDGAAAGKSVVFGVILGTGCGGGLVVNQQVIGGLNANAGEWGHNPLPGFNSEIDGNPVQCFCGGKNCLEKFVSGTGFTRQYNQHSSAQLTGPEIFAKLESGDALAKQCYELFIDQLARALASLINSIDPDAIVVGGGLSNVSRIYDDVKQLIPNYTISDDVVINLYPAKYGDSSGIRGAAWLAR